MFHAGALPEDGGQWSPRVPVEPADPPAFTPPALPPLPAGWRLVDHRGFTLLLTVPLELQGEVMAALKRASDLGFPEPWEALLEGLRLIIERSDRADESNP